MIKFQPIRSKPRWTSTNESRELWKQENLTEEERLTILLKALLANKDGLEKAITAIMAALSSSSSSGTSGAKVVEVVDSLVTLSVSLYGPNLEDTLIQSVALDLVKITIITASAELTETEKVRADKSRQTSSCKAPMRSLTLQQLQLISFLVRPHWRPP